ncbi:cytosolic phospholipase A2 gamma-like [Sinocyclocheilus grahami]|uniref:cytosolic phospholipase A2 gamma-like n=1 Tax=Sinocyclocheilus grahami TaxID=75366 RepID=UPI0007ACB315|nr:PREDICTED: cytosolic phospholipase A2 gamma-like [Sinocyclocheilus grahami]
MEKQNQHSEDPFPIYTAIDKQYKQSKDEKDSWFEISPHEAGYSLTGAFVGTSSFGSQFDKGSKKKPQDEMDMLYLQALCGSALADGDENIKNIWQKIKDFFKPSLALIQSEMFEEMGKDPKAPPAEKGYQVLMDLVDMNLAVLNGKDPSALDQSIRKTLNELGGGKKLIFSTEKLDLTDKLATKLYMKQYTEDVCNNLSSWFSSCPLSRLNCLNNLFDLYNNSITYMFPSFTELGGGKKLIFSTEKLDLTDKLATKLYMKQYTEDVCNNLSSWFSSCPLNVWIKTCICMAEWLWGRKYGFLHNMNDKTVPSTLLKSKKRDYEDAGLLLNSPYFSVLREERDIDLIISLDFSEGDPFMTVRRAADMCKKQNIPFPEVNIPSEDVKKPKDFYVFKGQNAPTVIHIPLFNVVNCGGKFRLSNNIKAWWNKYGTVQGSYSAEKITDLMEVAGKNISNNREKLKEQIQAVIEQKLHK